MESVTFATGCFWIGEAVFRRVAGVVDTAGGFSVFEESDKKQVDGDILQKSKVEGVRIVYDPEQVSFQRLLDVFWGSHDPAREDGQGRLNKGPEYRSFIFYSNDLQKDLAEKSKRAHDSSGLHAGPIVTKILPFEEFEEADAENVHFMENNLKST